MDFSEILINTAKEKESATNNYYHVENAFNRDKLFPADFFDKAYCYFSLQHINPRDARKLIATLSKIIKPKGAILIGDIPDKKKKWTVWYNTWRKRVGYLKENIYRKISGKEGEDSFGWWYHPNKIRKMCLELNLRCEILEQDKRLPHAHYRFDALILKESQDYATIKSKNYEEMKTRKNKSEDIKILFVSAVPITDFLKNDLELLRVHFDVRVVDFVLSRKNFKSTLMTLFKMFKGVLWADVTFSWFADTHAFWAVRLSKLFRKKAIVVVGGYEVAKIPEIGLGEVLNPKSARRVKFILQNADRVLTVDDSLKIDAIKNVGVNGKNIQTVPTGYDYEMFKPKGEKENLIITVSAGDRWRRVRLKGLDTFVKSAKFLPDVRFLVIGMQGDALNKLRDIAPSNVEFIVSLPQDELIPHYQKAKGYCQLSMREGLPNALCEAMLCDCVPIGTDVQGVRTAIGDTGFYVPYGDEKATAEAIKKALKSDKGKEARERVKNMFPIEKREKELVKIINEIVSDSQGIRICRRW